MKDLQIDKVTGDLVINKNDLSYVKDDALIRQKAQLVLGTNKTEWEYDANEGIDFFTMLTKKPDKDKVFATITDGLQQVDEGIQIDEFEMSHIKRHLIVNFTAALSSGDSATFTVGQIDGSNIRAAQN